MQGITVRLSQRISAALVLWTFYLCSPDHLPAQAAKFYEGKTVRIIVGSSPGGSFRYLGANLGGAPGQIHLPEHPPSSSRIWAARGL